MSLRTYEDARPWARAIKEEVMTRRMPKWHAVRGYGDFSNDPSLSAFEIALIAAWADGGAPRGVEADARAMSAATSTTPDKVAAPSPSRDVTLPCGEQPLPEGTLLAVQPELEPEHSAGIAVRLPDGRREIVAWIKGFDPEFPTTYRLRVPLVLATRQRDRDRRSRDVRAHPHDCGTSMTNAAVTTAPLRWNCAHTL